LAKPVRIFNEGTFNVPGQAKKILEKNDQAIQGHDNDKGICDLFNMFFVA
jgi:hypothetical protein